MKLGLPELSSITSMAALGLGVMIALTPMTVTAETIDFTADNETSGNLTSGALSGIGWEVTAKTGMSLTNATHWNNIGCAGYGWEFACAGTPDERYDVGFGINRSGVTVDGVTFPDNTNEIDGRLGVKGSAEFVQIEFSDVVKDRLINALGCAEMAS